MNSCSQGLHPSALTSIRLGSSTPFDVFWNEVSRGFIGQYRVLALADIDFYAINYIATKVLSPVTTRKSEEQTHAIESSFGGQSVILDAGRDLTVKVAQGKPLDALSVNVSLGTSKSQTNSSSTSSTSQGSTLAAGGSIHIAATGGGQDSNLLVQGSQLRADHNISLFADNQVLLLAGQNTSESTSSSTSSSSSIGVSFGAGGLNFSASASKSRGSSDGQDVHYTNTELVAGQHLSITSGGSTTLSGANVAGHSVNVDVGRVYGGDLKIESLQDTSSYSEQSKSSGGSISFGASGVGGSASSGKSNIQSNYASVTQQSGIAAGDGGFTINVAGNTVLTGGVITSTQQAHEQGKNSFQTGGSLTITDIHNSASYTASASNVTLGVGSSLSNSSSTSSSSSIGVSFGAGGLKSWRSY